MLVKTAEALHYQPKPLNDEFAISVYDQFLENLDPSGLILNAEDLQVLKVNRLKLDDQIQNGSCPFVSTVSDLYEQKLITVQALLEDLKKVPLDFNKKEAITYKGQKDFSNTAEVKDQWLKIIKLQVLSAYFATADSSEFNTSPDPAVIANLQKKVVDQQICRIENKLQHKGGIDQLVGSLFLKAIATTYDSHTNYFTPTEEGEFKDMLSSNALSYGFEVYRNDLGEVEIYKIIPGSPAWKSNELNEGDVILAALTRRGEAKDFSCLPMEDVVHFISSADVSEASFHFRKKNGRELQLTLHKEDVKVEDNLIQSYILSGDRKIGYIYLPSFYADMNELGTSTSGCAEDVVKELMRLKQEGIEGLILDLRDNGGGSMEEALKLVGIFINYGAIAIDAMRNNPPQTLKDMNRGIIFNGELVVMINSFSASASELFASAMQDQNRAVLVGTRSFGKATSQTILPLDAYRYLEKSKPSDPPVAYVKLTTGAFYRVTGESHQHQGIFPDIILPDIYSQLDLGESSFATALNLDSIQKKTYYFPANPLPLDELHSKSAARVTADSNFIRMERLSRELPKRLEASSIPLQFEEYLSYYFGSSGENFWEWESNHTEFTVDNPDYLSGMSSLHHAGEELNEKTRHAILTDIQIRESYHIIQDLINYSKN